MKVPYVEGSSDPPRPRVMAAHPQGRGASVDRGTCRPGIELRNPRCGVPTLWTEREGNTRRGASASRVIGPAESKTPCMHGCSMSENREIPSVSVPLPRKARPDRSGKACGRTPDVHAGGKSDTSVVPRNAGNKASPGVIDGDGGTVTPPGNRKGPTGNPPPGAEIHARRRRRTGGREGW